MRTFLLISALLISVACGGPEADWVYGTWTEELSGETVEFGRDKTVRWFGGVEGSFSFERNDDALCRFSRCRDGVLVINVDGQSFRVGYDVNGYSDPWTLQFKNRGGLGIADHSVLGSTNHMLNLRRNPTRSGAYAPAGFSRDDSGLGRLYSSVSRAHVVNGVTLGVFYGRTYSMARYSPQNSKWIPLTNAPSGVSVASLAMGLDFGDQLMISETGDGYYSLDAGLSWQAMPTLDAAGENVSIQGRYLGQDVYKVVTEPVGEGENYGDRARPRWLYRINLSSGNPTWEKTFDFPASLSSDSHYLELYSNENRGELYVIALPVRDSGATPRFFVSNDRGVSFSERTIDASITRIEKAFGYDAGLVFSSTNIETNESSFYWYNTAQDTWTEHRFAPAESPVSTYFQVLNNQAVSFKSDCVFASPFGEPGPCALKSLSESGEVSTLFELSEVVGQGFQTPSVKVVKNDVFLSALTVWRLTQP